MKSIASKKFDKPVESLVDLLSKSRYQKNKGVGFYKNGARNILFRLEALCRLYREIHNKRFFDYWYKEFKALEDTLGSMDHHEAMNKEFSAYKELKKSSSEVLQKCFDEEAGFMTDVLRSNGWLSGERMAEFVTGLNEAKWLAPEEDSRAYARGMRQELKKLDKKYRKGEIDLLNLEEGIHEFRRRLRWVSIYASASSGIIQLRQLDTIPQNLQSYCTPEILQSPFNVLSKAVKAMPPVHIAAPNFYAMSWLIQRLGDLKDIGQRHHTLIELCNVAGIDEAAVKNKFAKTCAVPPEEIFVAAKEAVDHFILHHGVLEALMDDLNL